jgi:hypothetical protein
VTINCVPAADDASVECSVTDTGVGIPDELLARLFNKFDQLEIDESRRRGGAGLGLVISKKIVEDLGGKIWVESKEGKGSRFAFTLPVYNENIELELELDASIMQARQAKTSLALFKLEADLKKSEFDGFLNLINHAIRGPADKAIKLEKNIFVILFDTDKKGALSVKERMLKRVQDSAFGNAKCIKSFSVAVYPDEALTCKELLEKIGQNKSDF